MVKQASREVQEDVIDLSTREQGEAGRGWRGCEEGDMLGGHTEGKGSLKGV